MIEAEIQAYLDAHNIRQDVRTPEGKLITMTDRLVFNEGFWFYTYDGLSDTGLKINADGTLWVLYDTPSDFQGPFSEMVKEQSLAHHFFRLENMMGGLENRITDQQFDLIAAEYGKDVAERANYGQGVLVLPEYVDVSTKVYGYGYIRSVGYYATGDITHEWE